MNVELPIKVAMGLRTRTIILLASIFIGIGVLTHVILSEYLIKQLKGLEEDLAMKDLARVVQGVEAASSNARDRVLDWGHWDETESFILGKNSGYVGANLTYTALQAFDTRHFVFVRNDGRVTYSGELAVDKERITPVKPSTLRKILDSSKIAQFMKSPSHDGESGLLLVDGDPAIVAISTVTDNHGERKPVGYIIFTRAFSQRLQKQIAQQTQLPLMFHIIDHAGGSRADGRSSLSLSEPSGRLVASETLLDMNQVPVMTVEFDQPRELLGRSEAARSSLLMGIAAFLFVMSLLVLWLLDKTVLKPLHRLSHSIDTISATNDLTQKVVAIGQGEIGRVAANFNRLIDSLDLSHQRMFEAKTVAQEANAAKSRFIAVVSHELRTPLQSLTGMLYILKKEEASETKLNFINLAAGAVKDLAHTINEILDFAKIEEEVQLESRSFSLRETVRQCLLTAGLPNGSVVWPFDLLYDIDPRIPDRFTGDVNRLGQILTNLLSNACKFTNNGEVALRIYMDNSGPANRPHVVFQIRDTGIGIAAGQLNRIFTPFYQVPLVSRAGFAGTGLGLAIVKKVVEQLEGEISVESTPGIGTTFSVSVPLAPSDEGLSEREAPIESAKSIVVFGEQTPSLLFFLEALKRYHSDVQHFEPKAISVAQKGLLIGKDAAVVWNDASPNVQLLQELVGAAKAAGVPLAAVSPPGDLTRLDLLRSLGIYLVLNTPVSVDDVLIAIRGNSCKPAPSLPSASKSRESQRRSMNVLVADDIPTNSYILSSLLENLGHTVEVVTNGVELLNRLRPVAAGSTAAPPVDLVLTDIQMPLMDGDVAVKRIRLIEGCAGSQHIPIIGVTARALPEEVASLKVAGLDHVLVKPVEEDDLLRLLSVYTGSASDVGRDTQAVQPSEEALVALVSEVAQEAGPITDDQGANHELLDARAIFKRSGKSVGKTRTILGAFAASYAQVRESIQRCAVQRDEVGLERSIHSLKGLLLDVGAYVPLDAIEAFEHSTKRGQSAERMSSDDFIADLLKQIDRVAILATRVQTELAGQQENETSL